VVAGKFEPSTACCTEGKPKEDIARNNGIPVRKSGNPHRIINSSLREESDNETYTTRERKID
jgi:hypothetical protein